MDPTIEDQHLKFLALKELCQYLEPKLRAVVIAGDPHNPITFVNRVKTTLSEAFEAAYGPTDMGTNGQARSRPLPAPRG